MSALVVRADANRLPLADGMVDLVVTSPPYFALRSYTDGGEHYAGQVGGEASPAEFIAALLAVTAEGARVLKPSGSMWVNLGDKYSGAQAQNIGGANRAGDSARTWAQTNPKTTGIPNKSLMGLPWRYALGCIDQLKLILRAEVIWSKPNGLPESVTDRVRRSHEQWFHFTKEPRYFAAVDEVREAYSLNKPWGDGSKSGLKIGAATASLRGNTVDQNQQGLGRPRMEHPRGKLPGSVWEIPTQPLSVPVSIGVDHFAAFPTEWPRRIVQGWSPVGGVVLDCFGGTGTTALVASTLGRVGISCDLSHDYSRLARWRTTDPGERAKAMRVDKPPVEVDGQADLFGETA